MASINSLIMRVRSSFDEVPSSGLGTLVGYSSVIFAVLGLVSGVLTYLVLSNLTPLRPSPVIIWSLLSTNIFIVTGLVFIIGWQIIALRRARRAKRAGARLHSRLVTLFAVIASVPAILVALFATVTLDRGLDSWFSNRTKAIINNTTAVATAYLSEHREGLRRDVLMMARDLTRASEVLIEDTRRSQNFITAQAALRSMPQAIIVQRDGTVVLAASNNMDILPDLPPDEAFDAANNGDPVLITVSERAQVRALMKLQGFDDYYLYATRFVAPNVLEHLSRSDAAVREYSTMESRRYEAQLTFALVYIVLTLVILLSAIWLGLLIANRLVQPISALINATQKLGNGDLSARVLDDNRNDDEVGQLARTFNTMAEHISNQQTELITARDDLDERAKFTEMVLSGVSSGVIGVDENGRVNHVNEAAEFVFNLNETEVAGRKLEDVIPPFAELLRSGSKKVKTGKIRQIAIRDRDGNEHSLSVSTAQSDTAYGVNFVITFDDVTNLISAQRTAAWADIARRIAHEIKNPLTPIQLSAERLQSKYGSNIADQPDIFAQCTQTIIRQVEDIGRMVDEFASFARMPKPVMREFDAADTVSQAVFLQRIAHPEISYKFEHEATLMMVGDKRQLSQALTNALKNAQEAVLANAPDNDAAIIEVRLEASDNELKISVFDNGPGWPKKNRYSLVEPYNTSRSQGSGLGLSIVKKVMEDHSGFLLLEDAPWCASGGTGAGLILVFPLHHRETVLHSRVLEEI